MARKTTSLKVEELFWKEVKKHCIDEDIDISDWIEKIAKRELKRLKKLGKNL